MGEGSQEGDTSDSSSQKAPQLHHSEGSDMLDWDLGEWEGADMQKRVR